MLGVRDGERFFAVVGGQDPEPVGGQVGPVDRSQLELVFNEKDGGNGTAA
jgi:hypothetical protein